MRADSPNKHLIRTSPAAVIGEQALRCFASVLASPGRCQPRVDLTPPDVSGLIYHKAAT